MVMVEDAPGELLLEEHFYNDQNLHYTDLFAWLDQVLLPGDGHFAAMVMAQRKPAVSQSLKDKRHLLASLLTRKKQKRPAPVRYEDSEKKRAKKSRPEPVPIWAAIVREIRDVFLCRQSTVQVATVNAKKVAQLALREVRRTTTNTSFAAGGEASRKTMREIIAFWRKNEREEKELRRRAEKLAQEQRRAEEEAREQRRQARKLDFLINQTELYAHFMARKLDSKPTEAFEKAAPDLDTAAVEPLEKSTGDEQNIEDGVVTAPGMLHCTLKPYQLRGLSWLASLWDQGINGILADEMGLGKTVQSIALLAHLAERHHVTGPFLVVTPASTLHNWMDELARFVPSFTVIPFWGPDRRQILKRTTFNIMVTSYQIVVSDERLMKSIAWQYMILDEAQAIKSASSIRWRTLLGINARNRLLLTGTPIQNTMAELWALLHFIMPGLFDSHDEFARWFSLEENDGAALKGFGGTPFQLRRLHAILRPFMLRRLKGDVEGEMVEKREVDVIVPPSAIQRRLMSELMNVTLRKDELKNIVMQARKLCNHPELLVQAELAAPLAFCGLPPLFWLPKCLSPSHFYSQRINIPRIIQHDVLDSVYSNESNCNIPTIFKKNKNRLLELPRLVSGAPAWVVGALVQQPSQVFVGCSSTRKTDTMSSSSVEIVGLDKQEDAIGPLPRGPRMQVLKERIAASGKMAALVTLLMRLKAEGHRVLIYFQMTRMMDIAEEILASLSHSLVRLDGTSRIEERRDMVHAFQTDPSIFLFLLSTRAGGLGINLTAADTVIFYDSDWNPTVDQQAMDRAHRLGQTRPVTVYRLITAGTIEERVQQRARRKHAIQKAVIEGEALQAGLIDAQPTEEELMQMMLAEPSDE